MIRSMDHSEGVIGESSSDKNQGVIIDFSGHHLLHGDKRLTEHIQLLQEAQEDVELWEQPQPHLDPMGKVMSKVIRDVLAAGVIKQVAAGMTEPQLDGLINELQAIRDSL